MDGLVDHRRSDPSTLKEELPVIRAGTRLEVLIMFFGLGGHAPPYKVQHYYTSDGDASEAGCNPRCVPHAR